MKVRRLPATSGVVQRLPRCFNGTAPVKVRRSPVPAKLMSVPLSLQWDRTREGAEVSAPPTHAPSPGGFNGTAPVKVRRLRRRLRSVRASSCFNGTAPVKVRRCVHSGGVTRSRPQLQWDRTREGAEVFAGYRAGSPGEKASMGPHLQWDRTREGAEVLPIQAPYG